MSVTAEQGLHRAKAFSASHIAMLARRLGVHGEIKNIDPIEKFS